MKPDFGQDAPGLLRGFVIGGVGAALMTALALALHPSFGLAASIVAAFAGLAAVYLLGMALLMLHSSRIAKIRDRDTILDMIAIRPDARVLDIGCGRGLMLIGAARRLTTGQATGIDLWVASDQADNRPDATMANAAAAGVADRIEVRTGDMRALPFPDASFDTVLSAWAIHNLPEQKDRATALAEAVRVLRPGGTIALTDIEHRDDYRATLVRLGIRDARTIVLSPLKDRIVGALSFGTFAPATVVGTKAA